jgi:hypothetical protein
MCYTRIVPGRTLRWLVLITGAAWGFAAYLVMWGYTPIVVTERFVESLTGLLLLLPARLVLESIHFVEQRIVHHPFDFSNNNAWIGYVASGTGAAALGIAWAVVTAPRRLAARRREREALREESAPAPDAAPR